MKVQLYFMFMERHSGKCCQATLILHYPSLASMRGHLTIYLPDGIFKNLSWWFEHYYPCILLSGFNLEGPSRNIPSSLATDPCFLAFGFGYIGTWQSHVPQDAILRYLELRGMSGFTSLGPLSQSDSYHYAMATLVLPPFSPKWLHGPPIIFQACQWRLIS